MLLENEKLNQFLDYLKEKCPKIQQGRVHNFDDLSFDGQHKCFTWCDYNVLVFKEFILSKI